MRLADKLFSSTRKILKIWLKSTELIMSEFKALLIFLNVLRIFKGVILEPILINKKLAINWNSSCNLLESDSISPSFKCLYVCSLIKCKSLTYQPGNCSLTDGNTSLIKYQNYSNTKITYLFSKLMNLI